MKRKIASFLVLLAPDLAQPELADEEIQRDVEIAHAEHRVEVSHAPGLALSSAPVQPRPHMAPHRICSAPVLPLHWHWGAHGAWAQ